MPYITYLIQENSGQAAAVNYGLKFVHGDYLTWLDPDDILPQDAIECKVTYLEAHPEKGTLISKSRSFFEKTKELGSIDQRVKPNGKDELFYDLILGRNSTWNCGCYMVRMSMFLDSMPKPLEIDTPVGIGQNMQLILPIVYKYPIGYLDKITYYYRIRNDSHSHMKRGYDEEEQRIKISESLLFSIVSKMDIPSTEINRVHSTIRYRIYSLRLYNAYRNGRRENLKEIIAGLKKNGVYDKNKKRIVLMLRFPIVQYLYSHLK